MNATMGALANGTLPGLAVPVCLSTYSTITQVVVTLVCVAVGLAAQYFFHCSHKPLAYPSSPVKEEDEFEGEYDWML